MITRYVAKYNSLVRGSGDTYLRGENFVWRAFGRVMGLALRWNIPIPELSLPSSFFRVWAGAELNRGDLYAESKEIGTIVDILNQIENLGVQTDESFGELLGGVAGGAVGLKEGKEWARDLATEKLVEMRRAIESTYDGIVDVVPAVSLIMFSSKGLEKVFKEGRGQGSRKGRDRLL